MSDDNYSIVRTRDAGVFAGELEELSLAQGTATLTVARRLWYWAGAASLSQLATTGTSKPGECKFPAPVDVRLTGVIEVLDVMPEARHSIEGVPIWTA